MRLIKLLLAGVTALLFVSATSASAAPHLQYHFFIAPQKHKKFFSNYPVPADVGIFASLGEPPFTQPLKQSYRIDFDLPRQLSFDRSANVCVSDIGQSGPAAADITSDQARSACSSSFIGSGSAALSFRSLPGMRANAEISIFNGGRTSEGTSLLIHGYSGKTGRGILMTGSFRKGEISIDIPPLSFNGIITSLDVGFPGEANRTTRQFARAVCNSGKFRSSVKFQTGYLNDGVWSDHETYASSIKSRKCRGVIGKPKPSVTVTAPRKVRVRSRFSVKIKVANRTKAGGRTKRATVRVRTSLAGKKRARVPALAPGQTKKIVLKFKARRKRAYKLTVSALGKRDRVRVVAK